MMHEYGAVVHSHVYTQLFLKQFDISQAIYGGACGKKILPNRHMVGHGPPNHVAWWVFYCTNGVLCIKSLVF